MEDTYSRFSPVVENYSRYRPHYPHQRQGATLLPDISRDSRTGDRSRPGTAAPDPARQPLAQRQRGAMGCGGFSRRFQTPAGSRQGAVRGPDEGKLAERDTASLA